ncbi:MAG: zinc ribbon domain-containing protein, partial [Lachnospiraceae bacterium]|nr:zinc ribbon domain-containing protein [Lachnospiraceae bacterium]
MALIKCKNCNNDISDKAIKCPNCGSQIKKVTEFNSVDVAVIITLALYCIYALLNALSFIEKVLEVDFVWQLYFLAIIIYYI